MGRFISYESIDYITPEKTHSLRMNSPPYSRVQFLRVTKDGPSLYIGDVPYQPWGPAGPSSGAAWTALCEYLKESGLRCQADASGYKYRCISSCSLAGEAVVWQSGPSVDRQCPTSHRPANPTRRTTSQPLRQNVLLAWQKVVVSFCLLSPDNKRARSRSLLVISASSET